MTIEKFLRQYRIADKKVKQLEREISKEQFLIDSIRSPLGNSGEPHGTGISKTVEARAIRIADKKDEFEEAKCRAAEIRQMVYEVVLKVDDIESEVLYEYYIDYFDEKKQKPKTWDDVADKIHVDSRTVYRIKNRALRKLSLNVSI